MGVVNAMPPRVGSATGAAPVGVGATSAGDAWAVVVGAAACGAAGGGGTAHAASTATNASFPAITAKNFRSDLVNNISLGISLKQKARHSKFSELECRASQKNQAADCADYLRLRQGGLVIRSTRFHL
jgi:hypothetical protein